MDLIILIILIVATVFFFRDFKSVVYFLGIVEILFRLVHIISDKIKISAVMEVVNKYVPTSLTSMISKYSSGLLYEIFVWFLIALFICFEFYLVAYFVKKKK